MATSGDRPTGGGWVPPGQPQDRPREEPYPQEPAYSPPAPAYAPPSAASLAPWGMRVAGYLVDSSITGLPIALGRLVYYVTGTQTTDAAGATIVSPNGMGVVAMVIGILVALALWVWNRGVWQGAGQSIGKQVMGLRLISESTREPVGTGPALLRDVAHILDAVLYLGYLWPLWDRKKQTFADKIMTTLSVRY